MRWFNERPVEDRNACWIWVRSAETKTWGADMDYAASNPRSGSDRFSETPLDRKSGIAIYRSSSGLKRFKNFHCPPFSGDIVIDQVWRAIILKFVPEDRIQFFPVKLIARGETTEEFSWVIPFDRVECIDIKRSDITHKSEKPEFLSIYGMNRFYHLPDCLGGRHIAQDKNMLGHVVVSNQLKEALSATGESSMFRKPEDMADYYSWN